MAIYAPYVGLPGMGTERQAAHRIVFRDGQITGWFSGGRILDGTLCADQGNTGNITVLRAGNVLGRVTSGEGGEIILERAEAVLRAEFPELAATIRLRTPDEQNKRHGQATAAASLPALGAAG